MKYSSPHHIKISEKFLENDLVRLATLTFIWHKLCLNTMNRYGDRTPVTLSQR